VNFLLDTNIFLEVILDQEKSEDAKRILTNIEKHSLYISDYSLHSLGFLLFRRNLQMVFWQFVVDVIFNSGIQLISLSSDDMISVVNCSQKFNLDFDDAYQYAVAEINNLNIISFDSDFDRTEKGRKTPIEMN